MSNPVSGFGYFLKGLTLITKPGVKRYVAIPVVINFIIFASLFWLLGGYVDEQIQKYVPELPQWLAWMGLILSAGHLAHGHHVHLSGQSRRCTV